ncbi:uncharacterized protein [Henckelia pumila]|uniref:uncharacterized protein n=1 Tax=Henckelia pumila TaxID=405737 RepID=UPI003C6E9BA3
MAETGDESHGSVGQEGGHHRRHHHHEGRRLYSINKFLQVGPEPLMGGENPEEARNWMAMIEIAFRAFNCTEEQKLEVLDFVLDGRACLWWDSKAAHARTERGRGSMTIDEYQQRFIDLIPYSPHINESDASKYDIFLQGLNQDFYSQVVVCYDPTSYETLVNRCRQVENSNRRAQLMMSG